MIQDYIEPLIVILIGGLFAPLLTQLIEKMLGNPGIGAIESNTQLTEGEKRSKRKRNIKLFSYAVTIQLFLFTLFFLCSKWVYFDKNYFPTNERELVREGIKKNKEYIIPKMTIRVYSESTNGIPLSDGICNGRKINHCSLISISYEIVALRDFNAEKIFSEYYEALYATKVLKEPGSDVEGDDKNPKDNICVYDIVTTMKKFDRKTITTRADFLYDSLPYTRKFFDKDFSGDNWDMFYYPNKEDDIIGEVEFQIISRSIKFNTPAANDAIMEDANNKEIAANPQLVVSSGECLNYNIITSKVQRLKNNESFGIKWSWNK
jgi:hypothetical protein